MIKRRIYSTMTDTSVRWAFNWSDWNPTEKEFTHAISCLQLDEKERLSKFVFRKDIRASLVGRLLIRKFVNDFSNIPYNNIDLTRDIHNRPILKNPPFPINFNVSHQGEYTVLAGQISDIQIGIDIMKFEYTGGKSLSEFFRIMNRNFSLCEWDEIKKSPSEKDQIKMFCRHWALKESYVKALGIGLTVNLQELSFQTSAALLEEKIVDSTVLYENGIKKNWIFEETLIDPNHYVAVAMPATEASISLNRVKFEKLNFTQLMKNSIPSYPEDKDYSRIYFSKAERP